MEQTDITIIGAGVVGLSIGSFLSHTRKKIFILEKNPSFGQETSSRNSEVIHSGIYYPYDSLKHRLCVKGRRMLYDLCRTHGINYNKTGKLIVATKEEELPSLEQLFRNGLKNEIEGLRIIDKQEIKRLEPNINAIRAISSPETGIIDSHALMKYFLHTFTANGGDIAFDVEVIGLEKTGKGYLITVKDTGGEKFSFISRCVINCAGLNSDTIASFTGIDPDKAGYRLYYSKGQYFRLHNHKPWNINRLIYPLPNLTEKSLGIHLTPDLNNNIRLGPDAHYIERQAANYTVDEQAQAGFYESVKKILPIVEQVDLYADTAGIRPKLSAPHSPVRDFIIREESDKGFEALINLIGIESPGLTASPAIGEMVYELVNTIFS